MRARSLTAMLLALPLLVACGPEPTDFTPGQMTFPVRSAGMQDHFFEQVIQICRKTGDPNDPDCVLRVKGNRKKCDEAENPPEVFQSQAQQGQWANRYMKCLDGR